jgi:hypothetical protein
VENFTPADLSGENDSGKKAVYTGEFFFLNVSFFFLM